MPQMSTMNWTYMYEMFNLLMFMTIMMFNFHMFNLPTKTQLNKKTKTHTNMW